MMASLLRDNLNFTGVLNEQDVGTIDGDIAYDVRRLKEADNRQLELIWRNIIVFTVAHILGVYGICLVFTEAKVY